MNHYLDLADADVPYRESCAQIFLAKENKPQLEACRLFTTECSENSNAMSSKLHMELNYPSDIAKLREVCRVFHNSIGQS